MIKEGEMSRKRFRLACLLFLCAVLQGATLWAQTDCEAGNGQLDPAQPKNISVQNVIDKLGASETATRQARNQYTFRQEILIQELEDKSPSGEYHEVTNVSFDASGRRVEKVAFQAQSTLHSLEITPSDLDEIRFFMPLILTTEDLKQYNLTYSGQQHVDDLDTYQFHIEPKRKDEKNKRFFEGRIWVDAQDFALVKICGKTGPEKLQPKKHQRMELRPTFVTYRQLVDGKYWFPAYSRSDDTLHFKAAMIQLREIVKYTAYKKTEAR